MQELNFYKEIYIANIVNNLSEDVTAQLSLEEPVLKANINQIFSNIFNRLGRSRLTLDEKQLIIDTRKDFLGNGLKSDICKRVALEALMELDKDEIEHLYNGLREKASLKKQPFENLPSLICSIFNNALLENLPVWDKFNRLLKAVVNQNVIRYPENMANYFASHIANLVTEHKAMYDRIILRDKSKTG